MLNECCSDTVGEKKKGTNDQQTSKATETIGRIPIPVLPQTGIRERNGKKKKTIKKEQ